MRKGFEGTERLFPAYAGMNRNRDGGTGGDDSVPRLRGDEPIMTILVIVESPCSPPTRG